MTTEKILKDHEARITALEKYIIEDGKSSSGKDVICEHCEYPWRTISKRKKTACPHCGNSVLIDKSNLPENFELIKMKFGRGRRTKCKKCLDRIRDPKDARYRHPNIYCKECFKEISEADRKEIDRGLKEIL